jgi:hypothetical protein
MKTECCSGIQISDRQLFQDVKTQLSEPETAVAELR